MLSILHGIFPSDLRRWELAIIVILVVQALGKNFLSCDRIIFFEIFAIIISGLNMAA